jgi:hypothetical protein
MRNTLRPGESDLCDGLQGSSLVLGNVESGGEWLSNECFF